MRIKTRRVTFIYGKWYLSKIEKRGESRFRQRGRRLMLWILWIGLLAVSISGWHRAVVAVDTWYWLDQIGVRPGPWYLAASGGVWGVVGLAAFVWVWLRRSGYRWAGTAAVVFFAVTYWADRLLLSRASGDHTNAGFALLMTLACLGFVLAVLRPDRRSANLPAARTAPARRREQAQGD
jgi:hypothetical protein